jgi:transposase InsO family protein
MLSDNQVRLLRKKVAQGKTVEAAAAAAGMSARSAYTWKEAGPLPSTAKKPRLWRTRKDPFEAVWATEVVPLLEADERGVLDATTVLDVLRERHGNGYHLGKLRTLQRRMRKWRVSHGPGKDVKFEQVHPPGREGAFDFTDATELGVTINGVLFAHLLFQFVLSYSGWRWACVALSETFEAMLHGLQGALWKLGGVPAVWRSDNLSAATHQLAGGGRELNRRYAAALEHYGAKSTRIRPRHSNENGVVEKGNHTLKHDVEQALFLRGSRDFGSVKQYEAFVQARAAALSERGRAGRLAEERAVLGPLPSSRLPEYTKYTATVRQWSTIHFGRRVYSVPSRLIGEEVEVRQYADFVEVYLNGDDEPTETMPRIRGDKKYHRIDYRHVIWSLVQKPGAFARYRYREELFPSLVFRRAYDALVDARGERADVEYVRVLHLAASTMQSSVEAALTTLLERGERPDYATVKALCAPDKPAVPKVHIPPPDLGDYDRLLAGGAT